MLMQGTNSYEINMAMEYANAAMKANHKKTNKSAKATKATKSKTARREERLGFHSSTNKSHVDPLTYEDIMRTRDMLDLRTLHNVVDPSAVAAANAWVEPKYMPDVNIEELEKTVRDNEVVIHNLTQAHVAMESDMLILKELLYKYNAIPRS
jgi:hypothetical protein